MAGEYRDWFDFRHCLISGHARAQRYTLDQAKALAMTGVDIVFNRDTLEGIKDEFNWQVKLEI